MRNRSSIRYGAHGAAAPVPRARATDERRALPDPAQVDPSLLEKVQVVRRRCTLCEWEAELIERGLDQDPLCPWCFGPTARAEIVGVVVPAGGTKNLAASSLGRLGGLKGGPARAQKLSPKRRREIASKAARARWAGKKKR